MPEHPLRTDQDAIRAAAEDREADAHQSTGTPRLFRALEERGYSREQIQAMIDTAFDNITDRLLSEDEDETTDFDSEPPVARIADVAATLPPPVGPCKTCAFLWRPRPDSTEGMCRRHPPQPIATPSGHALWPAVNIANPGTGCGEWEPADGEPAADDVDRSTTPLRALNSALNDAGYTLAMVGDEWEIHWGFDRTLPVFRGYTGPSRLVGTGRTPWAAVAAALPAAKRGFG